MFNSEKEWIFVLLIAAYDRADIEMLRRVYRQMGFPTFGSTCRGLRDFTHFDLVSAVWFPKPIGAARTEYAASPIRARFPDLPIFADIGETFTPEDAKKCPSLTNVFPVRKRFSDQLAHLRQPSLLYPREVRRGPLLRHYLNDRVLLMGQNLSISGNLTSLLSMLMLFSAPVPIPLIQEACFPRGEMTDNAVAASVTRINRAIHEALPDTLVRNQRGQGYYLSV